MQQFISEFEQYCKKPGSDTGKASSYAKAIQYLCEYLSISSLNEKAIFELKKIENEINNKNGIVYSELLDFLEKRHQKSYLEGGFIRAALKPFYTFINDSITESKDISNNSTTEIHQLGQFDSWEIIDESTSIKHCDKSFFEHNGSGIPKGICWFFDAEDLEPGKNKYIDLIFNGNQYRGRISNESSDRRRIRIFWNAELGNLFSTYNTPNTIAIFKKLGTNTYTVTLEKTEDWWPSKEEYDPGITKEKWLELLNDPEVFTSNRLAMMAQYYAIGGQASCAQMEATYGIAPNTYRMTCGVHLAEKIHKVTGCPLCNQENAKFWPVLFVGRTTTTNEPGNFMWRLRDELKAALEEFNIMQYLDISGGEEELSVKDTITSIKNYIAAKGFSYNEGMIENFYLSMKSKPFVILAGTSGTGKTRLVKLFAEAVGATTSNGRYKMVSVRPDWSDSSDLFGHISLNDKFIPGVIIDFIRKASFDEDRPYFLCLDEMNLARVEYYLSDILSIIETREFVNGKIQSDPLVPSTYYGPDLTAAGHYGTVRLPENLYIIGTVNMDETTFPFSRKVLDRANTIEFSYVDLIPNFDQVPDDIQAMDLTNTFLKTEYLLLNQCAEESETVNTYCLELQNINQILQKANAHVGYRVRDEIVFYLLNNKKYDLLAENDAMDNELMQKILPRIQGSSSSIKKMLCDLFKLCAGDYDGYNAQSDNISDKMKKALNDKDRKIKYRHSAEKIELMTRRFEEDGFTSYWL